MKKYISIILAVVLSICGLSACGQADSNQTTEKDEKQITVRYLHDVFRCRLVAVKIHSVIQ